MPRVFGPLMSRGWLSKQLLRVPPGARPWCEQTTNVYMKSGDGSLVSLGDFTMFSGPKNFFKLNLNCSWDFLIWPEAFERDHYVSTKDVERCFSEPTLQLLPVNCPYPYSLYSKLLQSCRVCIQIKTYLHIIIHIAIYIINFRSHVQFHIIAKNVSNVHCYPLFLEVPFYPEFVVSPRLALWPGCWFTRSVVKHWAQRP